MDDLQSQMNTILSNPQLLEQLKVMAQNIMPATNGEASVNEENVQDLIPNIDMNMLSKLTGIAGQTNIDKNQRTLLAALSPYLSPDRIRKLEKAMRASKMAGIATTLLGNTGR